MPLLQWAYPTVVMVRQRQEAVQQEAVATYGIESLASQHIEKTVDMH